MAPVDAQADSFAITIDRGFPRTQPLQTTAETEPAARVNIRILDGAIQAAAIEGRTESVVAKSFVMKRDVKDDAGKLIAGRKGFAQGIEQRDRFAQCVLTSAS